MPPRIHIHLLNKQAMNKHIQYLLFLLFLAVATNPTVAQTISLSPTKTLSETTPSSVGVSEKRLARLDAMLQKSVEEDKVPGVVALIARNGKIVYHKAYGQADETGRALKKDAIFRIASQTKAITSTAVMMLWEEGHFDLEDPIEKYIPEFKDAVILDSLIGADTSFLTTPAENKITIRHLLTHTSGLGYGVIDGDPRIKKIYAKAGVTDLFTTKDISIEQSVKKLAKLPLHHEPGTKWTYSEGLDVLGYFIEIISGMPFDQFLKTRIFEPLGMEDTYFYLPKEKADRLVEVQHKKEGKWTNFQAGFYDTAYPIKGAKRFFSGGAGLSSTVKDYANFLQMYLNKGTFNGQRLLSRTTVDFILKNQTPDLSLWGSKENFHGLAFGVVGERGAAKGGQGSEGTFQWGGYFNTQYFADPQEQLIGILFKQTQGKVEEDPIGKFKRMIWSTIDD